MLWEALAWLSFSLFFYGLGRLHRLDDVDPRMKYFFLLLVPAMWGAAFTLMPWMFEGINLATRNVYIAYDPQTMRLVVTNTPPMANTGKPDLVYFFVGDIIYTLILLGVSFSPYAFYVAGRSALVQTDLAGAVITLKVKAYHLLKIRPPENYEQAAYWFTRIKLLETRIEQLEREIRKRSRHDGDLVEVLEQLQPLDYLVAE